MRNQDIYVIITLAFFNQQYCRPMSWLLCYSVLWLCVLQVAVQSLWNMRLAVFVKPEHESRISHVNTASVKTGLGNTLGMIPGPYFGWSMGRLPITPHPPPRLRNECVVYTYIPVETAEGRTAHSNGWTGVNRMSRKPHVWYHSIDSIPGIIMSRPPVSSLHGHILYLWHSLQPKTRVKLIPRGTYGFLLLPCTWLMN